MFRVFLADSQSEVRPAQRLLLLDLNRVVVGDADSWSATLTEALRTTPNMLLVAWNLIPTAVVIVLISHLDARRQAALSVGADGFISKGETPD